MRILVVEDDRKVASFIRKGLEEEGHAVEVAADGDEAVERGADGSAWDLVVLDVMLPKRDGFSVLKALRGDGLKAPVLMLTARDAVGDRVTGLDLGADDYLTKPFAFEEFLARVRALLRRGSGVRQSPVLRVADLTLDPATREVRRGARKVELTAREYTLLEYFMRSAGRVLTSSHARPARVGARLRFREQCGGRLRRLSPAAHRRVGRAEAPPHRAGRGLRAQGRAVKAAVAARPGHPLVRGECSSPSSWS